MRSILGFFEENGCDCDAAMDDDGVEAIQSRVLFDDEEEDVVRDFEVGEEREEFEEKGYKKMSPFTSLAHSQIFVITDN